MKKFFKRLGISVLAYLGCAAGYLVVTHLLPHAPVELFAWLAFAGLFGVAMLEVWESKFAGLMGALLGLAGLGLAGIAWLIYRAVHGHGYVTRVRVDTSPRL